MESVHNSFYPFLCITLLLLAAQRPCNMLVYLRGGSAQTSLRAATLRWKLQIQLSTSPSQSILTPGQPNPGAWQGSHWSANFKVTSVTRPGKIPTACPWIEFRILRSRGGRVSHWQTFIHTDRVKETHAPARCTEIQADLQTGNQKVIQTD